jgi:hypothetical protein
MNEPKEPAINWTSLGAGLAAAALASPLLVQTFLPGTAEQFEQPLALLAVAGLVGFGFIIIRGKTP